MIASADEVASYKAATTIPLALVFITSSIITYIYPKFVNNRFNRSWLIKNYKKLILFLLLINGLITLICVSLAPFIIRIVFGEVYVGSSTTIFVILMFGFLLSSTLRVPSGSILDMLHLLKPSLIISIITGVTNIVLDILFIVWWGSIGAAIATALTYLICGVLSNFVLIRYIVKLNKEETTEPNIAEQ